MSTMQTNRKRNRSADADFHYQSKYFVNQRMVDSLDQRYMKTVFDKTMGLLFEGAKNYSNNNQLFESKKDKFRTVRLDGEGNVSVMGGSSIAAVSSEKVGCTSCNKMSTIQSECSNCNLDLCEHCGVSCANCLEAHICKHCVQLFENNADSLPCCRTCKMFT